MNTTVETAPARARMLSGSPVRDERMNLAGADTAVLVGGEGSPIVLLHGPGEFAANWLPIVGDLARTHRVVVPDLPGHGASAAPEGPMDLAWMNRWLDDLIAQTCSEPPVLVGRTVGGAMAARHAVKHPGRAAHLVLVDTTGLVAFAPDPRFGLALHRYLGDPTVASYCRFMDLCMFDLDAVRRRLGDRWSAHEEYAVEMAASPLVQAALGSLIGLYAATPIPADELARIQTPTTLVWGREDLATGLAVAQEASERYGWPLHTIDAAGDDPPLDRPDEFLRVLRGILDPAEAAR